MKFDEWEKIYKKRKKLFKAKESLLSRIKDCEKGINKDGMWLTAYEFHYYFSDYAFNHVKDDMKQLFKDHIQMIDEEINELEKLILND